MTASAATLSSRVGRGLGWSTASNLVLRMGNFATSILMARLIAPDQFGVFAVALTVWSILGTLAEFGLGTDLVRATDFGRRAPTVATLGITTSALLGLLMALTAGPLAQAFDSPDSTGVIRLMALGLVVFGFTIVPAASLQREFRQAALFGINGVGLIASSVTMTTLALMDVGPAALAWGQVASQLAIVVGLYRVTRTRPRLGFDLRIARTSAAFCAPLAFANLLSWLLLSIDNLVVARTLSPQELGLYVLAFNVSSWPMAAVGQAMRVVALPAFSGVGSQKTRNRALLLSSAPVWSVALVMGTALATSAPALIALLYGARWSAAAVPLAGLALFGALRVVLDLFATFLIAVGHTVWVLIVQIAWLVAMVPAMLFAVHRFGLAGAGWAHVVIALTVVGPAYLGFLKADGVDVFAYLRSWWLPCLVAAPTALASWFVVRHADSALSGFCLAAVVTVLLYLAPLARWWIRKINALQVLGSSISPELEVTT